MDTYPSGAVRKSESGRGRYDLIPTRALRRVAQRYEFGATQYEDPRNWEKGIPFSRMYSSASRHLAQWAEGKADEDHLAAVVFNVLGIMHFEENGLDIDLDDMPDHVFKQISKQADEFRRILKKVVDDGAAFGVQFELQRRIDTERDVLKGWAAQSAVDEVYQEPLFDFIDLEDEDAVADPPSEEEEEAAALQLRRSEHELCRICKQSRVTDDPSKNKWHDGTDVTSFIPSGEYAEGWRDEDELDADFLEEVDQPEYRNLVTRGRYTDEICHERYGDFTPSGRYIGDYPNEPEYDPCESQR